ncbi:MAG: hypothetical protein JNK48_20310 [Bryobacterales bacterium]|nr:hypothetical protein [Bryobacterales bacterium]
MADRRTNFPEPMAGGLCYILGPVSALFFLLSHRYRTSRFVRFHAWQSIFFSLGAVVAIALAIAVSALLPLEYVAWALFAAFAASLILTLTWFFAIWRALEGKEWNLPLAGHIARACL